MQRGRQTRNPRGHVSARSHTLFTTEPRQAEPHAHAGFVYKRLLPERGGAARPASRELLWKQGTARGQWEGGDYGMCFCCARGSIKRRRVSPGKGADFNQLTQGGKHTVQ